ncbi:MAG: hypothetical protein ABI675_19615 [Chitinophagaceae bacterium]
MSKKVGITYLQKIQGKVVVDLTDEEFEHLTNGQSDWTIEEKPRSNNQLDISIYKKIRKAYDLNTIIDTIRELDIDAVEEVDED